MEGCSMKKTISTKEIKDLYKKVGVSEKQCADISSIRKNINTGTMNNKLSNRLNIGSDDKL